VFLVESKGNDDAGSERFLVALETSVRKRVKGSIEQNLRDHPERRKPMKQGSKISSPLPTRSHWDERAQQRTVQSIYQEMDRLVHETLVIRFDVKVLRNR